MKHPDWYRSAAMRVALRAIALYTAMLLLAAMLLAGWTLLQGDRELFRELAARQAAAAAAYRAGGLASLEAELTHDDAASTPPLLWLLSEASGVRVAGDLLGWPDDLDLPADGEVGRRWVDEEYLPQGLFDDDALLPVAGSALPDGRRLLLLRGVDQAAGLAGLTEFLAEGLPVAILFALALAITLSRTLNRRMADIDRTAGEIMAGDLSRRMPLSERDDEFDQLSRRLNEMLDRIQQLVRGIREVTDNIAHDLRGPLTRMRNRLEVAALGDKSPADYAAAMDQCIGDADALIRTFNALLSIAQAEAGNHRCEWGAVPLHERLADLVELFAGVAEDNGQTLESELEPVTVHGSRDLLTQAVSNLLENALKYTPAGGRVTLQLRRCGNRAEICVIDNGPGIPTAEHEHVLERFVRLDDTRQSPGNGLGLSLVRAVSELHKGRLSLSDAGPGLRVSLSLPL